MAMISCSECGKPISERAPFCPSCGCPMEAVPEDLQEAQKLAKARAGDEKFLRRTGILMLLLIVVMLTILWACGHSLV